MANAKNRKLCWNCDGSVHIHATKCPYCGTDLVAEESPAPQQQPAPQPLYQTPPPPEPVVAPQTTYQAPPPPLPTLPKRGATTSALAEVGRNTSAAVVLPKLKSLPTNRPDLLPPSWALDRANQGGWHRSPRFAGRQNSSPITRVAPTTCQTRGLENQVLG